MSKIPEPVPELYAQGAAIHNVIDDVATVIARRLKVNEDQVRTPAAIRKEIVRRALADVGPLRQPHADIVSIIQHALVEAADALGVKLSCSRDTVSRDIHQVLKAAATEKQPKAAKPRAKNSRQQVVAGSPSSAISPDTEPSTRDSSESRVAVQENMFGGSD